MSVQKVSDAMITALSASKLTGSLPASMNEITKQSSDPTISSPATPTLGDMILNTSTGKLFVCTTVSSGANVWQAGVDGTVEPFVGMVATGGAETIDGDYKVRTFTSSGTFEVTTAGTTPQVEYLVIAGGGGGGGNISGGGGGAGGYLTATGFSVSAQTYAITVGAGGSASANGADSVFSTITSTGGGYGGAYTGAGQAGGSGGGSGGSSSRHAGGAATAGQGFAGGIGDQAPDRVGGGGGGASEVGSNGVATNILGQGGDGLSSSITGSAVTRGGGGTGSSNGGAGVSVVAGGAGGGGQGGNTTSGQRPTAGTVNTGGGGGGGDNAAGTAGGSGVVIIRYKFQ